MDTLFHTLKKDVRQQLLGFLVDYKEIDYVALDDDFWVSFEGFLEMPSEPLSWHSEDFAMDNHGVWTLPEGFKVMLKDMRWLSYDHCLDTFFSRWVLHVPTRKPSHHYRTNNNPRESCCM
jgi:hypothetical protein